MDVKHYDTVKSVLGRFISRHRQYRGYSLSWLQVEKVWNRGMGSRPLLKVSNSDNMIWVGKGLMNKSDEKHLVELIENLNNATGMRYVWMEIGVRPYPSLSLESPKQDWGC